MLITLAARGPHVCAMSGPQKGPENCCHGAPTLRDAARFGPCRGVTKRAASSLCDRGSSAIPGS